MTMVYQNVKFLMLHLSLLQSMLLDILSCFYAVNFVNLLIEITLTNLI